MGLAGLRGCMRIDVIGSMSSVRIGIKAESAPNSRIHTL